MIGLDTAALGVVAGAVVALIGHVLSRRTAKDGSVREWVSMQLERQDKQIARLEGRVDGLDRELQAERLAHAKERQAHAEERLRALAVVGYVRSLLEWIRQHMPGATPPEPVGLAREALDE